jgi:hypothetical protein
VSSATKEVELTVGGVVVPRALTHAPWPDPHMDIETYDPDADLMALNMGPSTPPPTACSA